MKPIIFAVLFYLRIGLISLLSWALGSSTYPHDSWEEGAIMACLSLAIFATLWQYHREQAELKRIDGLATLVLGWFHATPVEHSVDLINPPIVEKHGPTTFIEARRKAGGKNE